jgi:hypothetical protein
MDRGLTMVQWRCIFVHIQLVGRQSYSIRSGDNQWSFRDALSTLAYTEASD